MIDLLMIVFFDFENDLAFHRMRFKLDLVFLMMIKLLR